MGLDIISQTSRVYYSDYLYLYFFFLVSVFNSPPPPPQIGQRKYNIISLEFAPAAVSRVLPAHESTPQYLLYYYLTCVICSRPASSCCRHRFPSMYTQEYYDGSAPRSRAGRRYVPKLSSAKFFFRFYHTYDNSACIRIVCLISFRAVFVCSFYHFFFLCILVGLIFFFCHSTLRPRPFAALVKCLRRSSPRP